MRQNNTRKHRKLSFREMSRNWKKIRDIERLQHLVEQITPLARTRRERVVLQVIYQRIRNLRSEDKSCA